MGVFGVFIFLIDKVGGVSVSKVYRPVNIFGSSFTSDNKFLLKKGPLGLSKIIFVFVNVEGPSGSSLSFPLI